VIVIDSKKTTFYPKTITGIVFQAAGVVVGENYHSKQLQNALARHPRRRAHAIPRQPSAVSTAWKRA
jgi:hypothetical protein